MSTTSNNYTNVPLTR